MRLDTFLAIICCATLFNACTVENNTNFAPSSTPLGLNTVPSSSPTRSPVPTPTNPILFTLTPIASSTETPKLSIPSLTPILHTPTLEATQKALATLKTFAGSCQNSENRLDANLSEISPDGKWIALVCAQKVDGKGSSYLSIMNAETQKQWRLNFVDYANGTSFNRRSILEPFHWSEDGRFLFSITESTCSPRYGLASIRAMLRVNLNTGQVDEIVNLIHSTCGPTAAFSFSPSDEYLLYIPQGSPLEFYLFKLPTWETKIFEIEDERYWGANYAIWSHDEKEILLLVEGWDDNSFFSLLHVDLENLSWNFLLEKELEFMDLIPLYWENEDQVVLRNYSWSQSEYDFLLLNIRSGELTEFSE